MLVADVGLGVGFAGPLAAGVRIGESVQQIVLIVARKITEGGFETADAFAIEKGEGVEEGALIFGSFGGEDQVDIAIDESVFGAGRVGGGNDEVAEDDESFVLVGVEKKRLPIGDVEFVGGVDAAVARELVRRGAAAFGARRAWGEVWRRRRRLERWLESYRGDS